MVSKEEAVQKKIKSLIADFRENYEKYSNGSEADTETKLIEPLFEALGWSKADFDKRPQARREGKRGIADYAFKIGDKIVFYLEVKKVGVLLEKEADKQVISYALSKRPTIPFAVSTNFQELKIFCVEQENALHQTFRSFNRPEDFISDFQSLLWLSKDNFENGTTVKQAESEGRLKKRVAIDKVLLEDLMQTRKVLVEDIEKNYSGKYDLNEKEEIIQRIIDRLIFIRRCEDVGINPNNMTLQEVTELPHDDAYPKLKIFFKKYDEIYNSGLFAIAIDNDCDKIQVSGSIIKKLIEHLYESKDKQYIYNFDWIGADVLGQVYEQYLGRILRQTKSGRTKLKDGQAHRKEQGIYYTPTYVVDYIVRNTVLEALKNKKLKPQEIKVLDPACGSGSFLIKAFDYLCASFSSSAGEQLKLDSQGAYTTKTTILKKNLYGVDLDNKAVEITKLNLLLKAAEKYRKLPDDLHIQHGNSLVEDETIDKFAFHWSNDFKEGSFDVVIGNPPYILLQNLPQPNEPYFLKNYFAAQYKIDTYHLFLERAIKTLSTGGLLGFIVPNTFLKNKFTKKLREFILKNCTVKTIVLIPEKVFSEASVDTCIIILQKQKTSNNKIKIIQIKEDLSKELISVSPTFLEQASVLKNEDFLFEINSDLPLLSKFNTKLKLGDIADAYFGIQTFDRKKFVKTNKETEKWKPIIDGSNVHKYYFDKASEYVLFEKGAIKSGGNKNVYENEKIVTRQIGKYPIFCLVPKGIYALNTTYNITILDNTINPKFILGILNSKAIQGFWILKFFDYKATFPKIKKAPLLSIPIPETDDKTRDKVISTVDKMLFLSKQLVEFGNKNTSETKSLKDKILELENAIDREVYALYGLTNEEIDLIEKSIQQ